MHPQNLTYLTLMLVISSSSSSSSSPSVRIRTYSSHRPPKHETATAADLKTILATKNSKQLKSYLLANKKFSSVNETWIAAISRLECAKMCSKKTASGSVCAGFDYKTSQDKIIDDITKNYKNSNDNHDNHLFNITIITGSRMGAGTDSAVTVTLGIEKYEYSQPISTNNNNNDNNNNDNNNNNKRTIKYEEVFPLDAPSSLNIFEKSDTDTFLAIAGRLGLADEFTVTYVRLVVITSLISGRAWSVAGLTGFIDEKNEYSYEVNVK
ncbi:hypothetical protein HELRODRAFT_175458 [Helobdella robusta]|uniref:Uncharacterized protein n=1 Tax=Helobdella robusta TaxID=6412 RepID=T1F9A1_HELRO|nr:hypothetical protein HELRODRAFT_175458 [Helobdella robusta]ESO00955.1 hypothetical protein HELRODRAFT_175458 [Helobdella robusta]